MPRYPVPASRHRVEETIRRSRFITTVDRAAGVAAAEAFVAAIRQEFPDATHNCWAYLVGPPGTTTKIGMSDDGEPHGTAGRPMLEVLLHAGVGDVAAVVTRYFGGVKLGKGGLSRAYSGGVQRALETMPRAERVERVTLRVTVDYPGVDAVHRLAARHGAVVETEDYGVDATFRVAVPATALDRFRSALADATSGSARIEPWPDAPD